MAADTWEGGATGRAPDGSGTDSTVRLPGGNAGDAEETTARGFGGQYPADEPAPQYRPGTVGYTPDDAYVPPAFGDDVDTDRTLLLGGGGPGAGAGAGTAEPTGAARPADRLLVHFAWEILLLLGVAGLAGWVALYQPSIFGSGRPDVEFAAVLLGVLAVGLSLSLRAGVPNLAVGGFAMLGGLLFVRWYDHGTGTAAALAVGVALLAGLAIGIVVALFHVPGWAASLVALCGVFVAATTITHGRLLSLPTGASAPDPGQHALRWLIGVAAVSVLGGLLGLVGPLRRGLGAFRPDGDPARRRGPGAAVAAALALTVSSGLAAGAGVLATMQQRAAGGTGVLPDLVLALGAVLLGGVSAFGRRGGVLGTMLGVTAVVLVAQVGQVRDWPAAVTTYGVGGGAILVGLVVTRLVEWGGRRRGAGARP